MSDAESFLSRWARLKQESNAVGRKEPGPAALAVEPTREGVVTTPVPFDPASLPPVSSITQASDIRQFLQAGVPADLVRAALRAAWVADPAIRDFIEITDNQWDFNDPTAMPGFGPLEAADGARVFAQRSVARVNEVAGAVERMPELATRSAVDAANLPREGQVDRVWLSGGMAEQGSSRVGLAELSPRTLRSVTDSNSDSGPAGTAAAAEPDAAGSSGSGAEPDAAGDSGSRPQVGPRVHGTALPKART